MFRVYKEKPMRFWLVAACAGTDSGHPRIAWPVKRGITGNFVLDLFYANQAPPAPAPRYCVQPNESRFACRNN
eukprot:6211198-Pleurochrysis_carterae.AAC.7